ncbi:MAG: sdpI [Mucilaginibacter sp.]|nr:sdpI [Mucilaginibacter sp.]
MKKITLSDGAALVVWLLPIAYLLFIYADLPASVPMHYDIHGNVNRYGSKSEFAVFILIMQMVSLLVYFLLKFLPAIDPKKQVNMAKAPFKNLHLGWLYFYQL